MTLLLVLKTKNRLVLVNIKQQGRHERGYVISLCSEKHLLDSLIDLKSKCVQLESIAFASHYRIICVHYIVHCVARWHNDKTQVQLPAARFREQL